jgi:hypothetical protein
MDTETNRDSSVVDKLNAKLDMIPDAVATLAPGTGLNIPLCDPQVVLESGTTSKDWQHLWKLAAAHGLVKDVAKFLLVSSIWLKQVIDFTLDVLKQTPADTLVVESRATDQGLGFEFFTPGKFPNLPNQSRFIICDYDTCSFGIFFINVFGFFFINLM